MNLDQQVHQVTQGPTEGVVHALSAGVGRDLGSQTCQQPAEGLRSVVLQAEKVLESWQITPSMIWRFPDAHRRSFFGHARRESSYGVAATIAP
jgi:hypothetical protein